MKALFGIVSLLVALALVGILVSKQLHATRSLTVDSSKGPASGASTPAAVREQSQQIQNKVRDDVVKMLEQGARKDEPQP
jgi:hypothetical protein